jgi:DHA2 family multidrug resistance protein-like MFS transporter
VFGLTTEMIVGSAPPERAGAASGISETGAELGGALGIAILGSIGALIYRAQLATDLPRGLTAAAAEAARDTLGGALAVAGQLPDGLGDALAATAREAFVAGMHLTSAIATVVAAGLAALAVIALRAHGAEQQEQPAQQEQPQLEEPQLETVPSPELVPCLQGAE